MKRKFPYAREISNVCTCFSHLDRLLLHILEKTAFLHLLTQNTRKEQKIITNLSQIWIYSFFHLTNRFFNNPLALSRRNVDARRICLNGPGFLFSLHFARTVAATWWQNYESRKANNPRNPVSVGGEREGKGKTISTVSKEKVLLSKSCCCFHGVEFTEFPRGT